MTRKKKLKRRIRDRQSKSNERYSTARSHVLKAEGKKQRSQRPELDPLREAARAHGELATKSYVSAAKAIESLAAKYYPSPAAKAIESLAAKSYPSAAAKTIESLAAKSYPAAAAKAIDSLAKKSCASMAKTIDSLAGTPVTASMDPLRMLQKELEGAALALQRQLVTNPVLAMQKRIEEQMGVVRDSLDELQRPFREMDKLLRPL